MEIIGLMLVSPSTCVLTIPTPNFAHFPPLACTEDMAESKQKFLNFLNKTDKKKGRGKKKRLAVESSQDEEFADVDVSVFLFPTRSTLGIHLIYSFNTHS